MHSDTFRHLITITITCFCIIPREGQAQTLHQLRDTQTVTFMHSNVYNSLHIVGVCVRRIAFCCTHPQSQRGRGGFCGGWQDADDRQQQCEAAHHRHACLVESRHSVAVRAWLLGFHWGDVCKNDLEHWSTRLIVHRLGSTAP